MQATRSSFHLSATFSLVTSILMWATIPLFMRSFTHELDGWTANGARYGIAALFWVVPIFVFIRRGVIPRRLYYSAVIPSLTNIIAQTFWSWTVYYMEPGMVMFLSRLSLVFAILLSFALFPDERALKRSPYFWYGLALLVIGFVGMNDISDPFKSYQSWIGLLIVLGNSLFLAMYGVSVRYYMRGVQPWISFSIICMYTAAGLFVLMAMFGNMSDLACMTPPRVGLLILSAIMGIAFAHVTYYYAIEHLGVSISSGCQLSLPFLTIIGSYYFFGETFTLRQWIFGLGVLGGAALLLMAQRHLGVAPGTPVPACETPELEEFCSAGQRDENG
jgi:drug/metabolite transporter (DMT)-like permease